ncbi:MAG: magnesium transporter [Bacteroidales bacterium]|nr:magnesium transporter [Bacteroidales bacterium]
MTTLTTFYLSHILGKRFVSADAHLSGRIKDFLVDLTPNDPSPDKPVRPKVIAVEVQVGKYRRILDFSSLDIVHDKKGFRIAGTAIEEISTAYLTNVLWLKESILYRQVVDINGKKLEKVWDVRLVHLPSGTYAIAVDVGFNSWLRHFALRNFLKNSLRLFGVKLESKQILWDDIESVDLATSKLLLSKSTSKLSSLHPSDLADIIEDLDKATRTYVFSALNDDQAADVLEEMKPNAQVHIIESLPIHKAADLLEKMDADEAADIIEELEDEKAEQLLKEMEDKSSEEVRELLEYDDDEVGSIMNTDFFTLTDDLTAEEALSMIRKAQPEPLHINTIFISSSTNKFLSAISLAELVIADPSRKLSEIMPPKPVTVYDTDSIDNLAGIFSRYDLLSIPVINQQHEQEGMVLVEDIVDDLLESRKTR